MSLYGIGSYSAYSNLFSGMYSNNNTNKTTAADLQALMKKADEVRSPEYQKKIRSQLESGTLSDSEVGTVSSELKLSEAASDLKKRSAELSAMNMNDIKDKDALVKKVTAFAESYNTAVDAMGKSESVDALRAGLSMTNTVRTYSGALSRIGVKVGSDNKLTVNEETLRAADDNTVSSMFGNSYSPAARIADKAESISKAAANKAQTTAFREMMYGQTGSSGLYSGYNSFASSFIGTFFDSYT